MNEAVAYTHTHTHTHTHAHTHTHKHTHTMEYYSTIKKKETVPSVVTRMGLELTGGSKPEREREIPCDIAYMWNL